jgi:hypothetical protein
VNPLVKAARRWRAWSERYSQPGDGPHPVAPGELDELQPLANEVDEIAAADPFAAKHWPRVVRNIEVNDKRPYYFDADEIDDGDAE